MKKRVGFFLIATLLVVSSGALLTTSGQDAFSIVSAAKAINFDRSQWVDKGGDNLWETDEDTSQLYFDRGNTASKVFTGNLFLTSQFEASGATLTTVEATFSAKTTSQEIIDSGEEVHYGIVPWYLDDNNWVIVYPKYSRCDDPIIKNGHVFDVQCYVKLNGSTHVEYYVRQDGDRWIPANDPANIEWHSSWPDGFNGNMSPSSLQDTEPDPSDKHNLKVKKTRKTFAGKTVDTFYITMDGYELNFGRDNFNFSGLIQAEENNPDIVPMIGFYAYNTQALVVSGISVEVSNEPILPLPKVEPLTTPTKSTTVGKKVYIPDFSAFSNAGETLTASVKVSDPAGEEVYLEEDEYFTPNLTGEYIVVASATDSDNLTGKYTYTIKVKPATGHLDQNIYNDRYNPVPHDSSIDVAWGIFISVPVLIVLFIVLKIISYEVKKRKEKKVLNDEEDE